MNDDFFLTHAADSEDAGALCRPEQPDEAAVLVPPVDGPHHGGVLPPGRLGTRRGTGSQPHVRPICSVRRPDAGAPRTSRKR